MKKTSSFTVTAIAFSAVTLVGVISACSSDDTTAPAAKSSSSSSTGGTASGSSSSSSGATTSSSSSSSGGGGPSKYLAASCARMKKCTPKFYAALYAADADCTGATAPAALPGAGKIADEDKCATALGTAACGVTPPECAVKGTGAADATCSGSDQCGGYCKKAGAGDRCGKCAASSALDGPCTAASAGAECDAATFCDFGTSKCAARLKKDADCTTKPNGCEAGLACDTAGTKKCAEPTASATEPDFKGVDPDGACGAATDICRKNTFCVGATGEKKCKAFAKADEECAADLTKPFCAAGLDCVSGKCKACP